MRTLEECYEWVRKDHMPTDEIPYDRAWLYCRLLHDLDKRITELEHRQNPHHHNPTGDNDV